MASFVLFDDSRWNRFLPLTYTRAIADIRCGILTIKEKWEKYLNTSIHVMTESYLQDLYSTPTDTSDIFYINSRILPDTAFIKVLQDIPVQQALYDSESTLLAVHSSQLLDISHVRTQDFTTLSKTYSAPISLIVNYWDIFKLNDQEIKKDFKIITQGRTSQAIPSHVQVLNPEQVFIEPGAVLDMCNLNASHGPIYIGKDAYIMDGALLRGSVAIGEHAVVKMGAKVYEHTTIGPHCKVGGEVSNVIFHSYSNKGHDGYLGNALIGAWCNLGADTNCSNLKNDYGPVQVWSEADNKKVNTGEQFVGLMMGDHSKCAINTMFNTGTIVGICSNIFGAGFPPTFIPSFSWGWSEKMITHRLDKAIDANNRMMERRKLQLTNTEISVLNHVFNHTQTQRNK